MKRLIVVVCLILCAFGYSEAQNQVYPAVDVFDPTYHYESLMFGSSNKIFLGGKQHGISWSAYPSNSAGGFEHRYLYNSGGGTGAGPAARLVYESWGARMRLQLSNNHLSSSFGDIVTWIDGLVLGNNGHVGIGRLECTDYKLAVEGDIGAREINVNMDTWCDFVFGNDYNLLSIAYLKLFIIKNRHLPNIPSEEEVTENGVNVGEMLKLQMQKIEELNLYIIQLHERIKQLEEQVSN